MHLNGIKRTVGAAFDRPTMQRLLFHGTDAVDMIVNAPTGFLPLLVSARPAPSSFRGGAGALCPAAVPVARERTTARTRFLARPCSRAAVASGLTCALAPNPTPRLFFTRRV